MKPGLHFRRAVPDDDPAICQLLLDAEMNGPLELAYDYGQSFSSALEMQGYEPVVMVAEKNGNLIAVGATTQRNVYLNGSPTKIGYLSHLRIAPAFRKSQVLARGYRFLQELQNAEINVPFHLSSIMSGNTNAKILTAGRAGFPVYRPIADYRTLLLPIFKRGKRLRETPGFHIARGTLDAIPEVLDFLHSEGAKRQFFPVVTDVELTGASGPLKSIGINHFFIARDEHGRIAGTFAVWDQAPHKNIVIRAYKGRMAAVKKIADCVRKTDLLPDPENPVQVQLAACIAIRDDRCEIFSALLHTAISELRKTSTSYLAIGFDASDPLLQGVSMPWHLTLESDIHQVYWPDSTVTLPEIDGRIKYFELGML
jgi:hypothetical protein